MFWFCCEISVFLRVKFKWMFEGSIYWSLWIIILVLWFFMNWNNILVVFVFLRNIIFSFLFINFFCVFFSVFIIGFRMFLLVEVESFFFFISEIWVKYILVFLECCIRELYMVVLCWLFVYIIVINDYFSFFIYFINFCL